MANTIKASEVNDALKDLDKYIKSVTGVMNIQTIYQYIKQQNLIIKELQHPVKISLDHKVTLPNNCKNQPRAREVTTKTVVRMSTDELCRWLEDVSDGVCCPAKDAANRVKVMDGALFNIISLPSSREDKAHTLALAALKQFTNK